MLMSHSKRTLRCPLLVGAALLGLFLGFGGCSDDTCATCPDGGGTTADKGPAADASLCQKNKVTCQTGEINAFGVCLGPATMVKVAAGQFDMGKTATGKPFSPSHKVTLKEYVIDKTEVSVKQYRACVDCGACEKPIRDGSHTGREPYFGNAAYDDYPVIHVSWKMAKAFCEAIGKRLPTEAEWEKAARGNKGGDYPWGTGSPSKTLANFGGYSNDTAKVTDFDAGKSSYGALNMSGNVWEWVADTYDAAYYAKSPASDPQGPASSVTKVIRGGGFKSNVNEITVFARMGYIETGAFSSIGFRCAKDKW